MREKTIEDYLSRQVQKHGGKSYKFSSPARRGVPDRINVWPGGVVDFVEVKRPDGKLSKLQELEIADLRALNANVYVVWSKEDVREYIAKRV